MKAFKVGDLVRYIESRSEKGLYLVIETPRSSIFKNSPQDIKIKSVADGHEYWEVTRCLEVLWKDLR